MPAMEKETLTDLLKRAEGWPEVAQAELIAIGHEIEAALTAGIYHPTAAELEGIDRGLKDLEEGRFASDAEIAAVFAAHRPT